MLSNYIKSLIDIHNRVIVPDLGAFMLKSDASKVIYFNEFLRFNDGLLVDYIAEKEQIDKIEAAKKVKLFVDDVNKQLSANKTVEIEGIGTLFLDINEKIQLKTPESSTVPPVKQPESEVETSPREILFELENSEKVKPAETPTAAPPAPTSVSKPNNKPEPVKTTQAEPKIKPADTLPANEVKTTSSKKEDVIDVVPSTTRRMVVVGIFGALVIAAIVYFAFFQRPKSIDTNQNITLGDSLHKDSSAIRNDSAVKAKINASITESENAKDKKHKEKDKVKASEPKAKPVTATVQKSETAKVVAKSAGGTKFYLIAGSFSIEANADNMVKKLKAEGYTPNKIKNDKKNIFYVSFSSFADRKSAQDEMKRLKSSGKAESWIYAY